jgi:hypothetical protein
MVGEPESIRSVPDPQLLSNLAKAGSLGKQAQHFMVTDYSARTFKLLARSSRIPNARTHTLANQVALKLSDSQHDQ